MTKVFPRYSEPRPEPGRGQVSAAVGGADPGEPAFLAAFALVRAHDENAPARLGAFLTLSAFCRNTGLALLSAAFLFAAAPPRVSAAADGFASYDFAFIFLCIPAGLILLARHLKYRRLYTREVFLSALAHGGK